MRIISPFKDYYDSAAMCGFCHDPDLQYIRKEVELPTLPAKDLMPDLRNFYWIERAIDSFFTEGLLGYYASYCIVGFCGKLHPLIRVEKPGKSYHFYGGENIVEEFYKILDPKERKLKERFIKNSRVYSITDRDAREHLKHVQEHLANPSLKLNEYFTTYQVPYFIVERKDLRKSDVKITANANSLGKFEFYKIFNAQSTFQELAMFFNSTLAQAGHKNSPQITDSLVLLEAKGFDKRFSFRHRTGQKA